MSEKTFTFPSYSNHTDYSQAFPNRAAITACLRQIGVDAVEECVNGSEPIDQENAEQAARDAFDSSLTYTADTHALKYAYPELFDALAIVLVEVVRFVKEYNEWAEEVKAEATQQSPDYQHALDTWQENALSDSEWANGTAGHEIIMLSTGYAELWPDGDVVQHGRIIFNVRE